MRQSAPSFRFTVTASLIVALATMPATSARGELPSRYAPKPLPAGQGGNISLNGREAPSSQSEGATLLPALKGLVIASPSASTVVADSSGITISGLPWLDTAKARERLIPFLGQPLTEGALVSLRAVVWVACRTHDHPLVIVTVPEQDITDGVVTLHVTAARLGDVGVSGNRWFNSEFLASQISFQAGDELTGATLREDIEWLNANPFREVNMLMRSGVEAGTTDLILDVTDRIPFRVYTGYEDSGNDLLKEERVIAGFNWGNVFGLDHRLDFQYTAAPDFETVNSYAGSYTAPLPWRHVLQFFGGITEYDPDLPDIFEQSGESWQVGMRYAIPLPGFWSVEHNVGLGFDYKHSDNSLEFGGLPVTNSDTDIAALSLTWAGSRKDSLGATGLSVFLCYNPGWTSSDEAFEEARPGADREFFYARLDAQRLTKLPWDFTWALRFSGQLTNTPLVGSETFELGGYQSVRGYEEYEVAADDGLVLSNELRSPSFSVLKHLGLKKVKDEAQLLAFVDYGYGTIRGSGDTPDEDVSLTSVGVGIRYQVAKNMTVRADYGWQLEDTGFSTKGRNARAHIGVTVSY
jgi:hemolysin activation/secretion protein